MKETNCVVIVTKYFSSMVCFKLLYLKGEYKKLQCAFNFTLYNDDYSGEGGADPDKRSNKTISMMQNSTFECLFDAI